jgi:hypothetical protein
MPAQRAGHATVQRTTTYTFSRRWLGAAAAALVAVTAGITYSATRMGGAGDGQTTVATTAPGAAPTQADSASLVPPAGQLAVAPVDDTAGAEPEREQRSVPPAGDARRVARTAEPPLAAAPGAATYDREIAQLRGVVQQRRADLDSATVAVLERNLRVIDDAIAQSRAALARDPRSRFLGQQLERTLDQKLELLRTAALLPARS